MKTFQLLMIVIGTIVFSFMAFFIYYQNLSFQQELNSNKENLIRMNSTLSNYKNLFGEIQDNYTFIPFSLKLKVYVAQALGTDPVQIVRVNQPYQVVAQVTRIANDPVIYYYCIVDVKNEKDEEVAGGWGHQTMIPNQPSSQCGVRWTPTISGNYTISAFAWQDMVGTARANASVEHVQVLN